MSEEHVDACTARGEDPRVVERLWPGRVSFVEGKRGTWIVDCRWAVCTHPDDDWVALDLSIDGTSEQMMVGEPNPTISGKITELIGAPGTDPTPAISSTLNALHCGEGRALVRAAAAGTLVHDTRDGGRLHVLAIPGRHDDRTGLKGYSLDLYRLRRLLNVIDYTTEVISGIDYTTPDDDCSACCGGSVDPNSDGIPYTITTMTLTPHGAAVLDTLTESGHGNGEPANRHDLGPILLARYQAGRATTGLLAHQSPTSRDVIALVHARQTTAPQRSGDN